jgi:hypothetical protein
VIRNDILAIMNFTRNAHTPSDEWHISFVCRRIFMFGMWGKIRVYVFIAFFQSNTYRSFSDVFNHDCWGRICRNDIVFKWISGGMMDESYSRQFVERFIWMSYLKGTHLSSAEEAYISFKQDLYS